MLTPCQALHIILSIALFSLVTESVAKAASTNEKHIYQTRQQFKVHQQAPNDHFVRLDIALKQAQFHKLEQRLYEVSQPGSDHFRQHLSSREVGSLIQPTSDTLLAVERWLLDHQIGAERLLYSSARDWVTVTVPATKATVLLGIDDTRHHDLLSKRIDSHKMVWPILKSKHLSQHIDWIHASHDFMYAPGSIIDFPRSTSVEKNQSLSENITSTPTDLNQVAENLTNDFEDKFDLDDLPSNLSPHEACNTSAVTPLCVRTLYGTLDYKPKTSTSNSMALVNFDREFNNRSDIDLFLQQFRPDAARGRAAFMFSEENFGGGINLQRPATSEQLKQKLGREGNVDAQTLLSIAWPVPLITYTVGESLHPPFIPDLYTPTNTNEPFLIWLKDLLDRPDSALPKVLSISYGDIEHTVPPAYARRVCNSFAQLGARGVTVIFGAGDSGVGKKGYCRSNDGKETFEFLTSFPASCPYGTSVGATRQELVKSTPTNQFTIQDIPAYNPHNGFVTGGGFSKYFARPSYQDTAVQNYLTTTIDHSSSLSSNKSLFNPGGRGYPDVSISGYRRTTTWHAQNYLIDGTSVSAPTFAAIVALVNDALLDAGEAPLGFLNPWLYTIGKEAFRDVVKGNNSGCGIEGFVAGKGWDPVSGWGVPWFPRFKELALRKDGRLKQEQEQRPWYWFIED